MLASLATRGDDPRDCACRCRGMRCWLVNSGTSEEPFSGDLRRRYREWAEQHGEVQMFPWRPASMAPGDTLIHRAVGSAGDRLVAVGEVMMGAQPSGHERWPWQVRRRLVHVCAGLELAPTIADIGETASGLRVMKEISEESACWRSDSSLRQRVRRCSGSKLVPLPVEVDRPSTPPRAAPPKSVIPATSAGHTPP